MSRNALSLKLEDCVKFHCSDLWFATLQSSQAQNEIACERGNRENLQEEVKKRAERSDAMKLRKN